MHSLTKCSFSIPPEIVPGRMGLLVTTLLMLINTSGDAREKSAASDSFSLIDLWLGLCTIFVVSAIFEYAIIIRVKYHWGASQDTTGKLVKVSFIKR